MLALLLGASAGCAGAPPRPPEHEPERRPAPHPKPKRWPVDAVARSRAAFSAVRTADGERLGQDAFLDALGHADVICAGESHDDPSHHYVQLAILERLLVRAAQTSRRVAVGLEMLPRSAQPALDRYLRGETDEAAFLAEADWQHSWGFDYALYRPILARARDAGADVLALNAEPTVVRAVARKGTSGLDREVRASLPELDLDSRAHRRAFDAAMAEHPDMGMNREHFYQAQVLWDETMAETASRFLAEGVGARQMLILAGAAHCQRFAIAQRVERRLAVTTATVAVRSATDSPGEPPPVDYWVSFEPSAASRAAP